MASVNDTDTFLVNRNNTSYQLEAQNVMAELQDTDLMLVNRDDVSYKITGAEIKDSLKPPAEVIKPQIMAPADGAGRTFIPNTDEITDRSPDDLTFTFKSGKDLQKLSSGNHVVQDSEHTPLTDLIVQFDTYQAPKYSDGADSEALNPTRAFDGDGSTYTDSAAGAGYTITFTPGVHVFDTLKFYCDVNTGWGSTRELTLNGIDVVAAGAVRSVTTNTEPLLPGFGGGGNYTWDIDLQVLGINTLNTLDGPIKGGGRFFLYGIQVDGRILKDNETFKQIDFATSKDFINLRPGDSISEVGGSSAAIINDLDANGIPFPWIAITGESGSWSTPGRAVNGPLCTPGEANVDSVNAAANQLTVKQLDEARPKRWIVGNDKYMIGEEVGDPNAPDPSGINFVGSTFASSDGSLTAGSADWQVAIYAPGEPEDDAGYSNPVSSVDKHPDMGPPPQWTAGALEGETEYRARTKYYATTGQESPWSDDITFKTDSKELALTNKPGQVYCIYSTSKLLQAPSSQPPVKCINIVQRKSSLIVAIGTDGKMYETNQPWSTNFPNITWKQWAEYTGDKAVAFTGCWAETYWLVAQNDNTLFTSPLIPEPPDGAGNRVKSIIALGSVPNYVGFTTTAGENYIYNVGAGNYFGDISLNDQAWNKATINLPNGEQVVKISGMSNSEMFNYQSRNLAILSDAGNLYTVITKNLGWTGGPPKSGTCANPTLWLTDVRDMNPIDRSDILGGFSVLKTDGTLWGGFWSDRPTSPSPFPSVTNWTQIGSDTDWISAVYALPHELSHWIALKNDGLIYIGGPKSLSYAKLNYNGLPETSISTFGSLPYIQQGSANSIWVIIPDA